MLKQLFGGSRPDHPLADPKEARRLLEALPADDAIKALDELKHWMESVAATEGFRPEARIQLLVAIDDAAQPRLRKLGKDYFASGRPSRFLENRLWTALHGYWKQAGYAYARSIDLFVQNAKGVDGAKALLPMLLVRTLRSFGQQIKWMHMRYGPIDLSSWGVFNSVYAFAEVRQLSGTSVAAYPGAGGSSTPQMEFLKGAMFSASAPDGMLPLEVELAERFITEFAPRFALAGTSMPDLVFWTDLGQAMSPARMSRAPQSGVGLRFFGAGAALGEVHELAEKILIGGKIPPEVNLGGTYEPHVALEVLRHLHLYWAPQAPERKTQRHAVKSRLSVTHGYEGVVSVLGGSDSLDFDNQNSESWIVENVSAGGFGAVVPQLKGDWLRVGVLLALQPEGGSNWVLGTVRRVNKLAGQQARVGIETLCKTPLLSNFAVVGVKSVSEQGVLLKNADSSDTRIVLKPGVFTPGQNLEIERGQRHHVYLPQAVAERGEDYEIARFRELVREA
ncbi:MAG: hypothetical protein H7Y16_11345 [Candidatus Parcubacteria bacterium]|nr:hypothetical protein [Burkholderiales bacterium]